MIGIDTLRLRIRKPWIDPLVGLTIVPLAMRRGTPTVDRSIEYEDIRKGETGLARELNMHQDMIHIESKANFVMITIHLPQLMSLSFSRIRPLSVDEVWYLLDYVEEWCRVVAGVHFDILEAELSRMDIFANAESRYTFTEYKPLFEMLNFKRQMTMEYPNSYYGFNSHRATNIYNRSHEDLQVEHGALPIEGNVIRWEIRLRRARSIHRALNIRTVEDWLENWERPIEFYKSQVRGALWIGNDLNFDAPVTGIKEEIRQLMRCPNDTGALLNWLDAHGARNIQDRWRSIPDLRAVLLELGYTPLQAKRFIDKYRDSLSFRLVGDETSINDLKNELYVKLLS